MRQNGSNIKKFEAMQKQLKLDNELANVVTVKSQSDTDDIEEVDTLQSEKRNNICWKNS